MHEKEALTLALDVIDQATANSLRDQPALRKEAKEAAKLIRAALASHAPSCDWLCTRDSPNWCLRP